jgi:hypothetical protein
MREGSQLTKVLEMDGVSVSNERMDKAWTFVGIIINGELGDFVIHRHGHGLH